MPTEVVARIEALVALRRWAQASSLIEARLAEQPNDVALLGLLAQCMLGLGDYRAALRAGNRMILHDPEEEFGYRICALALDRLGAHDDAIRAAGEAVRLDPGNWRTHNTYAPVACDLPKSFEDAAHYSYDALRAAHETVRLAPNEPDAHFTMGLVSQHRYDRRTARKAYRAALALDPEHAEARNNLTTLTSPLLLNRSVAGYAHALRMAPDLDVAKENLDQLAQLFSLPIMAITLMCFFPGWVLAIVGGGPTLWTVLIGICMVAMHIAYVVYFFRRIPRSIRGYFARQLVTPEQLWYASMWVWAPIATLATCLLPIGQAVPGLAAAGMMFLGAWVAGRFFGLALS
ncbi:hypothetical protein WBG06_13910 [Nocardioides sp. CCNWLW239]|uniref:hypothetical protein n=1 Tax=Nocardioides sp. CCNWLW239 TaxID=3128902 RepID=UPI003016E80C